ncbi:MAG TPA: MiaB/RimO family radical SAM methylthiotransferase [Solirubrobacteraceae bacterium]|nr:MiaB/RimO family radical SAM methylthiotransferase [Solirubrobacteraceae bacterium]
MLNPLEIGVTLGGQLLDLFVPRPKPRAGCSAEPILLSQRTVTRTAPTRTGNVAPSVSTFAVKFLGCKVSQADVTLARQALLAAGYTEAPEAEAELQVVNTCCITREAEAKSRQSVRRSLRGARQVYVTGCATNLDAEQFASIDERVRPLVGTADDVAAMLGAEVGDSAVEVGGCADVEHEVLFASPGRLSSGRTRGFVKVQDGCDCHCAYCIIPTVRGRARSRPAGAVLAEVRRRVASGQPEMVMTGISVGDYRDPERGLELGQLMMEVARVPGVERVRLSSVEVIHVKDSLLAALAGEPKVCSHLHIPLQSGDDGVLEAMGRHYSAAEYVEQVQTLRAAVPNVNVTTDVIVGFPTENEAAFRRTLEVVEAAGISRVHSFSYSPRPGTVSAALGDRVTPEEKKDRSQRLRGHSEVRSRLHRAAKLGAPARVLIDKVAETQCSGYTEDYTRCYLPAGAGPRGAIVDAVFRDLHADGIRCEPAGEEIRCQPAYP